MPRGTSRERSEAFLVLVGDVASVAVGPVLGQRAITGVASDDVAVRAERVGGDWNSC